MDLGDRRRGQRLAVEAAKTRLERAAEVLLDDPAHVGERLGRHPVAAALELVDQLVGEDALAGGDDLAELDVGRAEGLGRDAEAERQAGDGAIRVRRSVAAQRARPTPRWRVTVARRPSGRDLPGAGQLGGGAAGGLPDEVEVGLPGLRSVLQDPRGVVAEDAPGEVGRSIHAVRVAGATADRTACARMVRWTP